MKNDLKYIIKKIIIGFGIAFLLFNLKKCDAYALDKYSYMISSRTNLLVTDTPQSDINLSGNNIPLINNVNVVESQISKGTTFHFGLDNTNNYTNYPTSLLHFITGDYEYFIQINFNPNGSNWQKLSSGNYKILMTTLNSNGLPDPYYYYFYVVPNGTNNSNFTQTTDKTMINKYNIYYVSYNDSCPSSGNPYATPATICSDSARSATFTDSNNSILYNKWAYTINFPQDIFDINNSKIIENKDNLYTYDGNIIESDSSIPKDYKEVNLNGNQALLVVPKNYNTMVEQSSHIESPIPGTTHTYLDLDYYSQNCVRGVLINIQNVQNILTSDISSGSGLGASAGSINGTCFEEPTKTILSYQYDMYSGFTPQGILIYNNQKIEPNWDSGFNSDFNPFGESFVWVNTNLYNYYLIPNLSTFNEDINYVDYDNTEKNLKIENLPTFEDLIEDTQLNQDSVNDNTNTRAKLESIFSFVKIPFTFLNNLINGTCEPLTARFPHSSTDIVLPCLSSSFSGWLGENAFKFFQLIINGLLVYKISIGLIQFTTKNLDPSDARIEVLDL